MKGLNMLFLGGGLLLIVLFFLGAYKVKEGFGTRTLSVEISAISKDETTALQRLKNSCLIYRGGSSPTYNNDGAITNVTYTTIRDGLVKASGTCTQTYSSK